MQRHPYKQIIMHLDFQRVDENQALRVKVPLHFLNQEKSPAGKTAGVVILHELNEVEVSCLPKDLPEFIEIDLSALAVGDIVHLSELKLPTGVEIPELKLGKEHDVAVVIAKHGKEEVEGAGRTGSRRSAGCQGREEGREVIAAARRACRARRCGGDRLLHRWLACASSSGWAIPDPNTPGPGTTPGSGLLTPSRRSSAARFGLESKLFGETAKVEIAGQNGVAAEAGHVHEPFRQVGHRGAALLEDRAGRMPGRARRAGSAAGYARA